MTDSLSLLVEHDHRYGKHDVIESNECPFCQGTETITKYVNPAGENAQLGRTR